MTSGLKLIDTFPKLPEDIIVAIDFGTSRTGVVWGIRDKIPNQELEVQHLEGVGFFSQQDKKSPTAILIRSENDITPIAYGQKAIKKSFDTECNEDHLFRSFKMKLHGPSQLDPEVKSVDDKKALPLSTVIVKSLEFIKNKVLESLSNQIILPSKDPYKLVWVITVPAIWTDLAKYIMRKAAYEAGMIRPESSNRLIIALEPECAFLGAMRSFSYDEFVCEKGKKSMIVDCGGGTIDITGYEIQITDPFVVRETIIPSGGHLGSTLIDQNFFDFIKKFIGEVKYEENEKSEDFNIVEFEKMWEERKLGFSFNRQNDEKTRINLIHILPECDDGFVATSVKNWNKENENNSIELAKNKTIILSYDLMFSFFKSPIENIIKEVNRVLSKNKEELKKLDYIILAGGFCRNIYLIRRLNEEFSTNQGIKVIIGKEPDLLIVKGAALFGYDPSAIIKVRKARYTFGVCHSIKYNPINPRHRKYYDKIIAADDGTSRLEVIDIHGRIEDDITVGETLGKRRIRPITESQSSIPIKIYTSTKYDPFHISEESNKLLDEVFFKLDMAVPFKDRGFLVEFSFGETEVYCNVCSLTGEYLRRIHMECSKFFS